VRTLWGTGGRHTGSFRRGGGGALLRQRVEGVERGIVEQLTLGEDHLHRLRVVLDRQLLDAREGVCVT
jgi:hypothetical protein